MLQREEEHCLLDIEIDNFVKRDWSGLARSDRELRMHIPLKTETTAHKKRWLYNVQYAFEKAYYALDTTQRSLFDFGCGLYDPV